MDQLDALAVRASRAATDVAEAHTRYTTVGTGSDHPSLRAAATHSRTGADKAHRLARLSSDASRHIGAYLNVIAPGSAPQQTVASGPMSGEDLLADSDRRSLARDRTRGFLNRTLRKADDAQDTASSATDSLQQWAKALRDLNGPSGTQSAGTGTPTVPQPAPRPKIDGPEAAGNLVVVGLLAGVATHRAIRAIGTWIARFNRGERTTVQRPDPGSGQG
ncbi:hypothetical protein O3597_04990 [Verrucosispora sp. WMMA2044]|uniref:hypothetical protein n=1 Tax=Verrucosispora sp. WMMA2044 TaxID=3016419 RepID=UPI00248B6A39|nr:hypothetical protein [Verrucosispora sp. WMMA2044]WBB49838.1 hypothetical protein O3597_04990 [Verrucosispora sp. WMMA2044]